MQLSQPADSPSAQRITGRALTGLTVAFLIFDGVTKVIKESHVMQASVQLGYPGGLIAITGAVLLFCTALYVIPHTAILGAILLTAYLGGAVAVQARIESANFWFPIFFGVLIWAGVYLRDSRLRSLIPIEQA